MTPLAQRLTRTLLKPGSSFSHDFGGIITKPMLLAMLRECQFFAIPDTDLITQVRDEYPLNNNTLIFLPANPTWVEIAEGKARQAFTLAEQKPGELSWMQIGLKDDQLAMVPMGTVWVNRDGPDVRMDLNKSFNQEEKERAYFHWQTIRACLVMINTPRLMGRKQHMPHAGLERELRRHEKLVGKFPLRAWTEIVLPYGAGPKDASGEPSQEAHLTGEKCLHFCRAHLRYRLGRMEVVKGHWRGNPAIGIKRSRYKIERPSL